jgi:hypothetical protein
MLRLRSFLFAMMATVVGTLGVMAPARGDLIALYDIPQGNSVNYTSIAASSTPTGITASNLAANGAIAPNTFSNHFYFQNWDAAVNLSKYYEATLTVGAGLQLLLDNVSYSVESTAGAGSTFQVRSSLDGFTSVIDSFTTNAADVTDRTSDLSGLGAISGAVTFRFYATAPTTGTSMGFANHQVGGAGGGLPDVGQDIQFFGSVVPVPSGVVLAGLGAAGVVGLRLRRRVRVLA